MRITRGRNRDLCSSFGIHSQSLYVALKYHITAATTGNPFLGIYVHDERLSKQDHPAPEKENPNSIVKTPAFCTFIAISCFFFRR